MMPGIDCTEAAALADAEFDGELDAVSSVRFQAHLADCPACAAEMAERTQMRAAIRSEATRYAAPPELRLALLRSLEQESGSSSVIALPKRGQGRWVRPAGAGFALGAALAASLTIMINQSYLEGQATDGLVAAHIRALQPGHLTDVEISDRHQVKPWFAGKIDFSPEVKDLGDQGFDLVGGRLDYLEGHPAAVIVYKRRLHLIDLVITRDAAAGPETASANGYNVVHWTDGGRDYRAVSDVNGTELAEFAAKWKAHP